MEVHLRLKKNFHEDVSEQDIIDCSGSHGNSGCDGGNTMKSFRYIAEQGFVTKRSEYPYENTVSHRFWINELIKLKFPLIVRSSRTVSQYLIATCL